MFQQICVHVSDQIKWLAWEEDITKAISDQLLDIRGRGFLKPSSESVLLTWENESTVTVCVLLERSKEIDTKGNSVSSEKLRKTDKARPWVPKGGKKTLKTAKYLQTLTHKSHYTDARWKLVKLCLQSQIPGVFINKSIIHTYTRLWVNSYIISLIKLLHCIVIKH